MPGIQYRFSGTALAAFIALLAAASSLGYGWYRAAITEMEAAASKIETAAQRTRREQVKDLLGNAASVTDCRSFWRDIVVPDYNDFAAKIDDLRHAFHCAISLLHLSDWVYVSHKAYIDANFTFRDKNGLARPVTDEKTFANALGELHPDFDLIRGIANSAKHLVLTNPRSHPAAPTHAANTRVQSTGYGQGGYGMGP